MSEGRILIKLDDEFTSITSDVVRVWFTIGDHPDDTASLCVMVRSVGHNNKVQLGMHVLICKEVRKALEAVVALPALEVWTEIDAAERGEGGSEKEDER